MKRLLLATLAVMTWQGVAGADKSDSPFANELKFQLYVSGDSVVTIFEKAVPLKAFTVGVWRNKIKLSKGFASHSQTQSVGDQMNFEATRDEKTTQIVFRVASQSVDGMQKLKTSTIDRFTTGAFYSVSVSSEKFYVATFPSELYYYDGKHFIPVYQSALEDAISTTSNGQWLEIMPPDKCKDALKTELERLPRMIKEQSLF